MSDTTNNQSAYCMFCGMQVAAKSNFCPFCGASRKLVEMKNEVPLTQETPNTCPSCHEDIDRAGAKYCHGCGFDFNTSNGTPNGNNTPVQETQAVPSAKYTVIPDTGPSKPVGSAPVPTKKADRIVAGVLAILLGSIGVHKFYMGKIGHGILCILFCWTGIPALVGLIEGILYLTATDQEFQEKYM
nr:NINE protein [Candidatus Sigynarchaeota archaeon]